MRKRMTPSEVSLWQLLRRSRLGVRFRRQEPIGPYIADFVCLSRKLVVEADGAPHEISEHDERRDLYVCEHGFRVLRFENCDIALCPEWVVEEIRAALADTPLPPGAVHPAVPSPRRGRGD